MKTTRRLMTLCFIAAAFTVCFGFTAFAKNRTITSVSIHVELDNDAITPGTNYSDLSSSVVNVTVTNSKYDTDGEPEIVYSGNEKVKIGDQIKVRVWLQPNSIGETDYVFSGSYSASNVSINGGTFVSASRSNGDLVVTFKTKAVKGTFDAPEDAYWSSMGHAKWTAPDNTSGYYQVTLKRGSSTVYTANEVHNTSYNLYPWMTSAGDYSFWVRTVPKANAQGVTSNGAVKSDWTESESYYIDKDHVSDGSGKGSGGGSEPGTPGFTAGWVHENGNWYYRYPDGNLRTNGWQRIDGYWYLFGSGGEMLTGWQEWSGNWYYIANDGKMQTGWLQAGGKWYYLNPSTTQGTEGAMLKNQFANINGVTYYLMPDGSMATGWVKIGDKEYYFYPEAGKPMGSLARNTRINTFYVGADGAWVPNM